MVLVRPERGWRDLLAREPCIQSTEASRFPETRSLSEQALRGFELWLDLIVAWAPRVDLTAARSAEELVDLVFADASIVDRHTDSSSKRWIDVGSGMGAPGLSLALLRPNDSFTLIEPRTKRVAFLRSVLGSLGLPSVRVERRHCEEVEAKSCDTAISRATLAPTRWLPEGARLAERQVWVLLAGAEPPTRSDLRVRHDVRYAWPLTGAPRRAICYELMSDRDPSGGGHTFL